MTKGQQPILDSYWVVTGRLRAGEYPSSTNIDEARRRLRWLLEEGTSLVIDLTEEGETKPYARFLHEEADKLDKLVLYKRMEIKDFSTPSMEKIIHILDVIDLGLNNGQNIYLHCLGGTGRTGMIVGCFLARHGIPGEDALKLISQWRKRTPNGGKQSPETDGQRRMILEWKKKQ
jgi:protein-tyrosine phosphatase